MKKEPPASGNHLDQWIERDLSRAAAAGELAPAFEVDDIIGQIAELLASGRNPILVGEPGIGKTAVIHELARRVAAGEGPAALHGKRLVQISLRRRAAGMRNPHTQMAPAMNDLTQHLH